MLSNAYFDTPELLLRKARWALRVRHLGVGRYEQTAKGQGKTEAGLHQRIEHNWPLESAALNLDLLKEISDFPAIDSSSIGAAFSTDFVRTAWEVNNQWCLREDRLGGAAEDFKIEVACDYGLVKVDGSPDSPISEIELELLQGKLKSLLCFGEVLVERIPCWLYTPSKAARGYKMLTGTGEFGSGEISSIVTLDNWVDVAGLYVHQVVNISTEGVEVRDFVMLIDALGRMLREAGLVGDPWDNLMQESIVLAGIKNIDELSHELSRSTWLGRTGMALLRASIIAG